MTDEATHRCSKCRQDKPASAFTAIRDPRSRKGVNSWCKRCGADLAAAKRKADPAAARARQKAYYASNPETFRRSARNYSRRKQFGISPEDFADMFAAQGGRCAICDEPGDVSIHVDHCHETGVIRGLLCIKCNTGLGMFRDSPSLLARAIDYLTRDRGE